MSRVKRHSGSTHRRTIHHPDTGGQRNTGIRNTLLAILQKEEFHRSFMINTSGRDALQRVPVALITTMASLLVLAWAGERTNSGKRLVAIQKEVWS